MNTSLLMEGSAEWLCFAYVLLAFDANAYVVLNDGVFLIFTLFHSVIFFCFLI